MVEHLLAALFASGEQGVSIEVIGEEIPALDGSAQAWWEALKQTDAQTGFRFVSIPTMLHIRSGRSAAHVVPIEPGDTPFIDVTLEMEPIDHPSMHARFHPGHDDFNDIALARTFAFETEVAQLHRAGLAKGGSLENAVILGRDGPINPEGLRFENEPARHKILDFIGDMSFLGALPHAHITLERPGHHLHHELVRALYPYIASNSGFLSPTVMLD